MLKGIKDKLNKVNWYNLSGNPNAIPILENNLNKFGGNILLDNPEILVNPKAIHIVMKNLDKFPVVYDRFWDVLLTSPNIFIDDYEIACRNYFKQYVAEEIMKNVFHPRNLHRMKDLGFEEDDDE
jgi:hypothetical protein